MNTKIYVIGMSPNFCENISGGEKKRKTVIANIYVDKKYYLRGNRCKAPILLHLCLLQESLSKTYTKNSKGMC